MLIKSPLLFYLTWMLQIGSFFMINLCLVVIATQFSETKRRETAKMKAERARFRSSSTLSSFTNSETTNCYREIIKLIAHLIRKAVKRTKATYRFAQQTTLKQLCFSNAQTNKLAIYIQCIFFWKAFLTLITPRRIWVPQVGFPSIWYVPYYP